MEAKKKKKKKNQILVDFFKKTVYNAKITKIEGKIPSITGIATTAALLQLKIKYLLLVV